MASGLKKCTQLTGLPVCKHPHRVLSSYYTKILRALENIPKDAAYRRYTSKIIEERLAVVESEPDVQKLEQKINGGQVEEIIVHAERELMLTRKMITWKPWESLAKEAPSNQWKWPI